MACALFLFQPLRGGQQPPTAEPFVRPSLAAPHEGSEHGGHNNSIGEDRMTRNFAGNSSCSCGACNASLSRRQFLCTTAAGAVAVSAVAATVGGTASAQQPGGATAPARAILIRGGGGLTPPPPVRGLRPARRPTPSRTNPPLRAPI